MTNPQQQLVDKWRRMQPDLQVEETTGGGAIRVKFNWPKMIVTVDRLGKPDQGVPYK